MRKQTKLVAVASAAALLAIGASMTSFAATGWVEENGQWFFYDKDGNRVEDEWKKSGDNWYWLDSEEEGAMATDKLVDDDDATYYVDANGVMVRNTWVKVVNEDQDEEDDPAEYNYYYMQTNGKAYKSSTNNNTKFRTIDGKRYAFDEDGKMLYGWVDEDGARITDESGWETATYFLGSWQDGAMKTGWQKINVFDSEEDDDVDYWFNFKSNGKKRFNDATSESQITEKKINGRRYGFDERGVMTYEWTVATGSQASTSTWKYFNSPEDGARVTKGWFKVVAPTEDNSFGNVINGAPTTTNTFDKGNAEDESEKWYYADGDGNLYANAIKKIKGKYYAFAPSGYMLNGLVLMSIDDEGEIDTLWDDGVDSDELSDLIDGTYTKKFGDERRNATADDEVSLYYFGNDEDHDGAMKTGSTTVTLDGDTYSFMFNKTGGVESRGKGVSGIEDNKYIYKYGMRVKADSDDKYIAVAVESSYDTGSDEAAYYVEKVDLKEIRANQFNEYTNKDKETVKYHKGFNYDVYEVDENKVPVLDENGDKIVLESYDVYLVGTSGAIVKNKTAAKDGNDWYFYVEDKEIKMYTNNKTLAPLTEKKENGDLVNVNGTLDLSDWKNDFNSTTK